MLCVKVTFISFIILIGAFGICSSNLNAAEEYEPHIAAFLKYLNSNPNKIYDYTRGVLVNAQAKADIIELTIDVDVLCTVSYPGVPCTERILTCNGFLQYSDGEYRVLSNMPCKPKRESSVENLEEVITISTPPELDSKIELSHETVSSEQNADFVAVKADSVLCLGCPFDLNTDVEGVSTLVDTALKHIETEKDQKQAATKVIRLQQQIVAGIKYILTVEVTPTVCQKDADLPLTGCPLDSASDSAVCEVIFLQKPWVSREKIIIGNNCTVSQEFTTENYRTQRDDISNEINSNTYIRIPYEEQSMSPQRLADLESQIVMVEPENSKPILKNTNEAVPYTKVVPHKEVIKNSNDQFYSSNSMNAGHEPFVTTADKSGNTFSTPFSAYSNGIYIGQTDTLPKIDNENQGEQQPTEEIGNNSPSEYTETDPLKQPTEERLERVIRELNSPISANSDSSGSQGDDKTNESTGQRRKRNADNTSESKSDDKSDSNSEDSRETRRERDLDNTNSDSSESQSDKTVESIRPRRKRNTVNTSESKSDDKSDSNSEDSREARRERDLDNTNSDSSESQGDKTEESIRSRRSTDHSRNDIRKDDDDNDNDNNKDDSSSSSSSSSSESKEDKHNKEKENKNGDSNNDNSSSSSSSSDESKTEKDEAVHKKNDDENSSSSSSSSDSSESKEENEVRDGARENKRDISVNINIDRVRRSVGQLEKITQEEKFLVRDLADFAASSLDSIDEDNHKRVILQILGAKKLKLDGIYYHIILRLGVSRCSETEDDDTCREKLFTNLTKICKVLVHVENDLSNPKVVKSQCQNIKKDDRDRNRTNYSRYRRDTSVGAPSDIPVDHPKVLEFTRNTLTQLDSQSDQTNKHKVVKIVSATSQVVAGSKYKINVTLSLSNCPKTDDKPLEECDIPEDALVKSCLIVVWDRPWLNLRETTVKCNDSDTEYKFGNTNSRRKRSVSNEIISDKDGLEKRKDNLENLGGIEKETPDNLKAARYLKDILTYLDRESGHFNKLKIHDIVSVEKQVVAGELWRIKARLALSDCPQNKPIDTQLCEKLEGSEIRTCIFKIWDRPWLPNGREVQTSCEEGSEPYTFRLKRSVGSSRYIIPSSLHNENKANPKVLQYIKTGLHYLDCRSNHGNKYMIKGIKKVSKQTVAGTLWHVSADVTLSDCPKHTYTQYCDELENSDSKVCQFAIWEQDWLSTGLQINVTCEDDGQVYTFFPTILQITDPVEIERLLIKFGDFIATYNKIYSGNAKFNYRLKVFADNLDQIELLNKYEQGSARYEVNQFADMTQEEFSKSRGLRWDLTNENEAPFSNAEIPDIELPTAFDWRAKGAVTEVKNQESCGSCWAFSTTGNIEGQYAIKYGKLLEFSEQELVDCDKLDDGCDGGLMDNAYRAIEKMGGLESESDYPYDARDEKCHFNKSEVLVQLSGAVNISHNEDDMAKWLVKNGPISIAINANAMQFYAGGISHPWKMLCNPKNLDHGVLIVGYGVHSYPKFNKTLPFWIVKNSWGKSWGEQGYYRVYRGDGTCGVNQTPSSAIVA